MWVPMPVVGAVVIPFSNSVGGVYGDDVAVGVTGTAVRIANA